MQSYPLRKRFDVSVPEKNVKKGRTSGSTGQPLDIRSVRTEGLIQLLKILRFLREWGYSPFHYTIRLWGGSAPIKLIVNKFGLFRIKDVEILDKPASAVDEVLKSRPDILFASRSSLEALADELDKRKIEFKPRILVSTGEILMEKHRKMFLEKYGCNTLNCYSSEEMGSIAWECPDHHRNIHTDMETVLINFRNVFPQSNGKIGSIILTNLERFVMPFIRYDQEDRILIPSNSQCPCGRTLPLLGRVLGRNDDVIDYNGREYYWNFFYNILVKENFKYIKRYKIIQTKEGSIEFIILLFQDNNETRKKCISDLKFEFENHFKPINIRFVDDFSLQPNRKFKVIEKET
jgi:phenylacetate-CoA ligase